MGAFLDVQIQKEQQSPVEYRLQVTVPAEHMTEKIQTELEKVAANIKLPGFRPGHIPRRVVVERFGSAVTQEVLQDVLQDAYRQALEKSELNPVSPGEMDDVQFKPGDPLTFTVKVEIAPEIEVPALSEVSVEMLDPTVEDVDILSALDELREQHAVVVPTEDPVDRTSVVTVDLQELDPSGLPVVGHAQKGLTIDMSRENLDEELIKKLMGMACEQTTVVEFPVRAKNADEEPKTTRYEAAVRNIQRKELPPLDDELAKTINPSLATLDDLKADIRRYLDARAKHSARERMFRTVVEELLHKSEFVVPPRMLDDYLERMAEDALHRGHDHRHDGRARRTPSSPPQRSRRREDREVQGELPHFGDLESALVPFAQEDHRAARARGDGGGIPRRNRAAGAGGRPDAR